MSDRLSAIRFCHMAPPNGLLKWVRDGTNERTYARTQQTHATKTRADNLLFLNARVGLWITRISRQGVTA